MKKPNIPNNEKTEFRKRLDVLMTLTNTTNADLAKLLGVKPACISNYKAVNGRTPSVESLILMANYFNVSIDFLLGNSGYFEVNLGTETNPNRINYTAYHKPLTKILLTEDKKQTD